jgi:hypothetical protein
MASKRRIRRRACKRKVRYPAHDAAQAAIRAQNLRGRMPYPCRWCGGWHVGRPTAGKRKAIEKRMEEQR